MLKMETKKMINRFGFLKTAILESIELNCLQPFPDGYGHSHDGKQWTDLNARIIAKRIGLDDVNDVESKLNELISDGFVLSREYDESLNKKYCDDYGFEYHPAEEGTNWLVIDWDKVKSI